MASIELVGTSQIISYCSANLINRNYLLAERSDAEGQPIELYYFLNTLDSTVWSYNNSDSIIVYNDVTYLPVLIRRKDIQLNSNVLKSQVEIEVHLSNPFARCYIQEPIEGIVQLIIYRQHYNSYVTYWKGYVATVKFRPKIGIILANLKTSSLKRFGLMRKFQRSCGLPLYSTWCGISKEDSNYYVDGTINFINGTTIDATIFGTKEDGWFKGGIFKTDNGNCLQRIVYHIGTEIKIGRSVSAISAGNTFRAWAGCNHAQSTCDTKFDNKLNYGGQLYTPDKNPFTGDPIA